jgi:uncharacterized caspase-like protein
MGFMKCFNRGPFIRQFLGCVVALLTLISLGFVSAPNAEPTEKRIALVIGNAAYRTGALATSANDAGLIAQSLQAAGFDVVGARDLDQDSLRRALREFLEKASSSGPDTVAFIYLNGYGLQLEGENYFVPVDANIRSNADVAAEALRLSDYTRPLRSLKLKASIVVLDAARRNPFSMSGEALAGGLALVEPSPGMLVAFNAAPGTIAPERDGPYGAYTQALAEMMREGGLPLRELFERVRLRVNDTTKGAQVPWSASRIKAPFIFFERSPDAPSPAASPEQMAAIRSRPLRDLAAPDAYLAAVERDTLEGYEEFLVAYPDDPMAKRVRAIIAARRESVTWQSTYAADTPDAYWSYLRRYPHGPHSADARRRLALRAFASEPPPSFAPIDYDVAPPPPEELAYVDRPALEFADPAYDFAPPPALPVYFLPPPPLDFIMLPPPPPPIEIFALPIPVFVPIPVWCHRPDYVARPPENVIFNNIHSTVVIDHATKVATIKHQNGQIVSSEPRSAHGAVALGAPLPPSLAKKAALIHPEGSGATPAMQRQRPGSLPLGQPLPGTGGHPLPQLHGRPPAGGASTAGIAATMHTSHPAAPGSVQALRPQSAIPHNLPTPPASTIQKPPPQSTAHSAFGSATIGRPQVLPPSVARTTPPPPTYRPPAPTQTYRPAPPVPARVAPPPAQAYRPPPPRPAAHAALARAPVVSRPSPPPPSPPRKKP